MTNLALNAIFRIFDRDKEIYLANVGAKTPVP